MVSFAEAPVAEPGRHAVRPERVNDVRGANFVAHRVEIKPEIPRDVRNFFDRRFQLLLFLCEHRLAYPPAVSFLPKNARSAFSTSPFSLMMLYMKPGSPMLRYADMSVLLRLYWFTSP